MLNSVQEDARYISKEFDQDPGDSNWSDYQLTVLNKPPRRSFGSTNTTTNLSVLNYPIVTGEDVLIGNGFNVTTHTLGTVTTSGTEGTIDGSVYDGVLYDLNEFAPRSIEFKDDGTAVYVLFASDEIKQYNLSTPWDLNSASYSGKKFSLSAQSSSNNSFRFANNGEKMYVIGYFSVRQYSLSTPWEINTASFDNNELNLSSYNEGGLDNYFETYTALELDDTGENLYVVAFDNDNNEYFIKQYILPTPYNIQGDEIYKVKVPSGQLAINAIRFNKLGTKFFVISSSTDEIHQYTFTSPWSLNSINYDNVSYSIGNTQNPIDMSFNTNGDKMFVLGNSSQEIRAFTVGSNINESVSYNCDISSLGFVAPTNTLIKETEMVRNTVCKSLNEDGTVPYDFNIVDYSSVTATSATLIPRFTSEGCIYKPHVGESLDFQKSGVSESLTTITSMVDNSVTFDNVTYDTYQSTANTATPIPHFFGNGSRMYDIDWSSDTIYQYNLGTPWEISTAAPSGKSFSVAPWMTYLDAIFMSSDGINLYAWGRSDKLTRFTLSTPWEINTATYVSTYDAYTLGGTSTGVYPYGFTFKADGTKLFMFDYSNENGTVHELHLGTAWDLATITNPGISFDAGDKFNYVKSCVFNGTGTRLFATIPVGTNYNVRMIRLDTPWDLTSAHYDGDVLWLPNQRTPTYSYVNGSSISFKTDDYSKMFLGSTGGEFEGMNSFTIHSDIDDGFYSYDVTYDTIGSVPTDPYEIILKSNDDPLGTPTYSYVGEDVKITYPAVSVDARHLRYMHESPEVNDTVVQTTLVLNKQA